MIKGLWKEITNIYKNDSKIILISIKREDMTQLNDNMQIDLVPSFIAYKEGKNIAEFSKKREYENIINFINKYQNK
jgi:thioredoxin-like negative regulator of GroEL